MTKILAADKWNLSREEWVGQWVTYHGTNRANKLANRGPFKVVSVREQPSGYVTHVGFQTNIPGLDMQWCAVGSVEIADNPDAENVLINFLEPHKATLDVLDAEIKRYEEKIRDLKAARQVIAGL